MTKYFVSNTGNDSNSGTSPSNSWLTWQKVFDKMEDLTIVAGDRVKLKCGNTFDLTATNNKINQSYDSVNRLTFESYGIGTRPILRQTENSVVLQADAGSTPKEGLYFRNLIFDSGALGNKSIRVWGQYNYITVERCENIGSGYFFANDMSLGYPTNHTLRYNTIRFGGVFGGSDNYLNEHNHYIECNKDNNGDGKGHALYMSGSSWGHTLRNLIVRNNVFENSSHCLSDGKCCSTTFVVHGILEDVLVEKNIIIEAADNPVASCYGISFSAAYTTNANPTESYTRVTIQDNLLLNIGRRGIHLDSTFDSVVRRNTIIQTGSMVAYLINLGAGDMVNDNILIENNDLYIEENASKIQEFVSVSVGTNIIASNNNMTFFTGNDSNFTPICFDYDFSIPATGRLYARLDTFAISNQTGVTYTLFTGASKGVLVLFTDGRIIYDPNDKTQASTDSFTYKINDNGNISEAKTVNITITAPQLLSTITGVNDDDMELIALNQDGSLELDRKNTEFTGPWVFDYRLTDVNGVDTATVTVNIT